MVPDQHPARVRHRADARRVQVPLREDLLDLPLAPGLDDDEHPLLRLGEHDLVGVHPRLALRHPVELDLDARPAPARGLAGRAREPGGAHVLDPHDEPGHCHHLEARLDQQLLHERVALLHRGPIRRALRAQFPRRERGSAQAVPPRGRAHVIDRVAQPRRPSPPDLVVAERSQAQGVDQRIALVGAVEVDVPPDGGNADAVAVMRDAGDHAPQEPPGDRGVEVAESQGVRQEHRARAHREYVADDPADPGRRALERLDGARMVVRLDLERDRPSVAHVDDARVLLARPDEHPTETRGPADPLGRESLKERPRVLVRAVLRPHHGEDPELREGRIPLQVQAHLLEFLRKQAVLPDELRRDGLVEDRVGIGRKSGSLHAVRRIRSGYLTASTARATESPSRLG